MTNTINLTVSIDIEALSKEIEEVIKRHVEKVLKPGDVVTRLSDAPRDHIYRDRCGDEWKYGDAPYRGDDREGWRWRHPDPTDELAGWSSIWIEADYIDDYIEGPFTVIR